MQMQMQQQMMGAPMVAPAPARGGSSVGLIIGITLGVVALLILGVGVLAFLMVRSAAEDAKSSSYTPSSYSTSGSGGSSGSGSSKGGVARIGERVEVDDSTWTITDAKDMGKVIRATDPLFSGESKATTGRFIRIHYKVVNDGKKQEVLLDTPKIVDSKSREFGPVEGESEYVPSGSKTAILETLQPSMERDFYTIIEVPSDATDLKVQLTALGLSGEEKMVDIDL
jgi:hypothetical protein